MIFNREKFNPEIAAFKKLNTAAALSPQRLDNVKQRVLLAIRQMPRPAATKEIQRPAWTIRLVSWARPAAAVLLGLSLVGGTALASTGAKPGDILYPVKRATETIRLDLAVSEEAKANLQSQFAQERLKELRQLRQTTKTPQSPNQTTPPPLKEDAAESTTSQPSTLQLKAQAEASLEVNSALQSLQKVKLKLEAKGDDQAAGAISQNIERLQKQAQIQNIKINSEPEDQTEDPAKPEIDNKRAPKETPPINENPAGEIYGTSTINSLIPTSPSNQDKAGREDRGEENSKRQQRGSPGDLFQTNQTQNDD
ncbi:MAG: hypothetical protein KGJ93_01870 [Patescibacteria group bacterium]|nr:hypothetical protein [Patescibacteria group bacterium]